MDYIFYFGCICKKEFVCHVFLKFDTLPSCTQINLLNRFLVYYLVTWFIVCIYDEGYAS